MNMTAVAIVAIVCWAIVELVTGTKNNKKGKQNNAQVDALQQQVQVLKERVETLEKIVTDDKYELNRQFDSLRKDKVA
jgi:cell division protein FtsB